MRSAGLLLLRPDCLRSGNAVAMVDHLTSRYDLRVAALRVLRLTARQFLAMYKPQISAWGDSAWLHRALLTTGPSAVLLLNGDCGPYPDVRSLLESIKGPSLAAEQAPDSLRQRFGRQSSFHSVLHCSPDSTSQSANIRLFFKQPGETAPIPRQVWSTLLAVDPPAGASVFEAAAHTARRLVASRLLEGQELPRLLPALTHLLAGLRQRPYPDQRTIFLGFARRRESELRKIPALLYLFGCRPARAEQAARLIASLERSNVPVSDELAGLLYAGVLADINPTATWEGRSVYPFARFGKKSDPTF